MNYSLTRLGALSIVAVITVSIVLGAVPSYAQAQTTTQGGGLLSWLFGSSRVSSDPVLSIVQVPGTTDVYRIVNGRKHLIPNEDIFASYGYTEAIIRPMTAQDLARYPLARLFVVYGDESLTTYYLTNGGMIRPVLNDDVFFSYGNRKEDVVYITQKELNFYPRNQFIFVERPHTSRDVFQVVGGVKRFVTPMAMKRMKIKDAEVAPVNIMEFDAYPASTPIIF